MHRIKVEHLCLWEGRGGGWGGGVFVRVPYLGAVETVVGAAIIVLILGENVHRESGQEGALKQETETLETHCKLRHMQHLRSRAH